mmetsp:Transcript_129/g.381  ORF Transcript_129/g.381 Transcript_129/m.381 type:complete len:517 (-) Transcript_129:9-1559(-)
MSTMRSVCCTISAFCTLASLLISPRKACSCLATIRTLSSSRRRTKSSASICVRAAPMSASATNNGVWSLSLRDSESGLVSAFGRADAVLPSAPDTSGSSIGPPRRNSRMNVSRRSKRLAFHESIVLKCARSRSVSALPLVPSASVRRVSILAWVASLAETGMALAPSTPKSRVAFFSTNATTWFTSSLDPKRSILLTTNTTFFPHCLTYLRNLTSLSVNGLSADSTKSTRSARGMNSSVSRCCRSRITFVPGVSTIFTALRISDEVYRTNSPSTSCSRVPDFPSPSLAYLITVISLVVGRIPSGTTVSPPSRAFTTADLPALNSPTITTRNSWSSCFSESLRRATSSRDGVAAERNPIKSSRKDFCRATSRELSPDIMSGESDAEVDATAIFSPSLPTSWVASRESDAVLDDKPSKRPSKASTLKPSRYRTIKPSNPIASSRDSFPSRPTNPTTGTLPPLTWPRRTSSTSRCRSLPSAPPDMPGSSITTIPAPSNAARLAASPVLTTFATTFPSPS